MNLDIKELPPVPFKMWMYDGNRRQYHYENGEKSSTPIEFYSWKIVEVTKIGRTKLTINNRLVEYAPRLCELNFADVEKRLIMNQNKFKIRNAFDAKYHILSIEQMEAIAKIIGYEMITEIRK